MSPPPSASVRPVLYGSSFAVQHAAQIANLGTWKEGRKEGKGGHDRARDGTVTSLALKTFGRSPLFPLFPRRRCRCQGRAQGVAYMRPAPCATRRRRHYRKSGEGRVCALLHRVPVSPSHWFYGYKWLHCRRSGLIASHNPSPSPLVTRRKLAFIPAIPLKSTEFHPSFDDCVPITPSFFL